MWSYSDDYDYGCEGDYKEYLGNKITISDDGNYLFTTDEQQDCYIGAYDVSNISDIQQIDLIQSWNNVNSPVIPHNTHVIDN